MYLETHIICLFNHTNSIKYKFFLSIIQNLCSLKSVSTLTTYSRRPVTVFIQRCMSRSCATIIKRGDPVRTCIKFHIPKNGLVKIQKALAKMEEK